MTDPVRHKILQALIDRYPVRRKILQALIDAGGRMTLKDMEKLYERRGKGGDALHLAVLNRLKLTQYARDSRGDAIALCILDSGRKVMS